MYVDATKEKYEFINISDSCSILKWIDSSSLISTHVVAREHVCRCNFPGKWFVINSSSENLA